MTFFYGMQFMVFKKINSVGGWGFYRVIFAKLLTVKRGVNEGNL